MADQLPLIADQLVLRAPHQAAREALLSELQLYPRHLLRRAARVPVRVWLLDHGEAAASAAPLDQQARATRWHGGSVGLEDCAGLTISLDDAVLVIAPWYRPKVLRHELGHALSALLGARQRRRIEAAYASAHERDALFVPLAGASVGEYVACGLAAFTRPAARRRLATLEPELAAVLDGLWQPTAESGWRLDALQCTLRAVSSLLANKLRLAPSLAQ